MGGTVFTEIQIEAILLFVKSQLVHTCCQLIVVILSLASANDLADTRNQTVHSCYGLSILIGFHVERLDLLRIVGYKYRAFEYLLGQITFMLGLQIASPGYFIIKFIVILFQNLHSLCIGHMSELRVQYMVQTVQKTLVHEGIKEVHLFRSILQYIADDIFEHGLCHLHVVIKICECHLRLDHPELCCMTGGVGILCTEGRSEGIDITECLCIGLAV